jgi:uncharacterized membrane protein
VPESDVRERLSRLERRVEELHLELRRVSALVPPEAETRRRAEPVQAAPAERPPQVRPRAAPTVLTPLQQAWRALERGETGVALESGFAALRAARNSSDARVLHELEEFAAAAVRFAAGDHLRRAENLARDVRSARPAAPRLSRAPRVPASTRPPAAAAAPAARHVAQPVGPTHLERATEWLRGELAGARAFAVAGGTLTLLGIVFLFVLAANRGWIGPNVRVGTGAAFSLALVGAAVWLRGRYGHVKAASAAAGAGIAGAYTTLAAATILYGLVPEGAALLVAAAIAAGGATLAIAWSSQLLAGLALVGAVTAPAAVALDSRIGWPGTAFALVVFAATIAVASPRRWLRLQWAVAAVAVAQVAWLATTASGSTGSVVVASACVLLLLVAAIAWQAYGRPVLEEAAVMLTVTATGVTLWAPTALLSAQRDDGLLLLGFAAVFAATGLGVGRRWRDLGWTVGAEALLLAGVAAALLLSGRSLTIVFALEAVMLTAVAWRLCIPRFAAAGLVYLGAAVVHSLAVEVAPSWPTAAFDVPRGAAPGLFVVAAAALAVSLLLPSSRRDERSSGLAAVLEPLWDGLVRRRVEARAVLVLTSTVFVGAGTAAVVSERWLTLVWAALAATLAAAAAARREARLQVLGFGFLAAAAAHAVAVEVPLSTLMLGRGDDALAPIPSLVALALVAVGLAATPFEHHGIGGLGPLHGPEVRLAALWRQRHAIRRAVSAAAAVTLAWAVGLAAVGLRFEPGHLFATAAWSGLFVAVAVFGTRVRSLPLWCLAAALATFALTKAALFDWSELGDWASASVLVVAVALLAGGFLSRWLAPAEAAADADVVALVPGAVAAGAALVALERVLELGTRSLGLASLAVVAALLAAAAPPYLRRRRGASGQWLRTLSTGYGALALAVLLFAEIQLAGTTAGVLGLWALTGLALALGWEALHEDRVWIAAVALSAVAAAGCIVLVTPPSRLVEAMAQPAASLWALAAAAAAAWAAAVAAPVVAERTTQWLYGGAATVTLYGASLGVLALAQLVSQASVQTDFQRGQTALSATWGVAACVLYVAGLRRESRHLRTVGLCLFGLSLVKLFLYDLSTLSSITRALSFLVVGGVLLVAGFFAERLVRTGGDVAPPDLPARTT